MSVRQNKELSELKMRVNELEAQLQQAIERSNYFEGEYDWVKAELDERNNPWNDPCQK